jgi:hypothetical protein
MTEPASTSTSTETLSPPKTDSSKLSEIAGAVSLALGVISLLLIALVIVGALIDSTLFVEPELQPNQYWVAFFLVFSAVLPFLGVALGIGALFQPSEHKLFAISGVTLNAFLLIGVCCVLTLVVLSP